MQFPTFITLESVEVKSSLRHQRTARQPNGPGE